MAFSLVCVLAGDHKALFQTCGSRWTNQASGSLLGRVRSRLFHVFHDSGVLLNAVLSSLGSSAWLSNGRWRQVD
jgi:hypothetical protein